jgi:hypothetical protein
LDCAVRSARNLFRFVSYFLYFCGEQWPVCFVFPLLPCRAVAGVSSGFPILFIASCFCLTRVQWLSLGLIFLLLLFSVFPPLRARFLAQICWSGFVFFVFPARRAARLDFLFSACSLRVNFSVSVQSPSPDQTVVFGFHFAVSRFGREARRLTKDLQSSICRPVEIRGLGAGPCAASGFRLGAAKSLCARIGFPVPRSRSARAPSQCLLPISVFCVRSRQELASFSPALARFPLVCDLLNGQILSSCV